MHAQILRVGLFIAAALGIGGCITSQGLTYAEPFDGVWTLSSSDDELAAATIIVQGGVIRTWFDATEGTAKDIRSSRTSVVQAGRIVWSYDLIDGAPRFVSLDVEMLGDGTLSGTMTITTIDPFFSQISPITLDPF